LIAAEMAFSSSQSGRIQAGESPHPSASTAQPNIKFLMGSIPRLLGQYRPETVFTTAESPRDDAMPPSSGLSGLSRTFPYIYIYLYKFKKIAHFDESSAPLSLGLRVCLWISSLDLSIKNPVRFSD
jgi:hypothetical protein